MAKVTSLELDTINSFLIQGDKILLRFLKELPGHVTPVFKHKGTIKCVAFRTIEGLRATSS